MSSSFSQATQRGERGPCINKNKDADWDHENPTAVDFYYVKTFFFLLYCKPSLCLQLSITRCFSPSSGNRQSNDRRPIVDQLQATEGVPIGSEKPKGLS